MGIQETKSILDEILRLAAKKTLVLEEVEKEEAFRRLAICNMCDRLEPQHRKCLDCGCYVDIKTASKTNRNPKKIRYEITHCPNGYWGDKDVANEYRRIDGKELLN